MLRVNRFVMLLAVAAMVNCAGVVHGQYGEPEAFQALMDASYQLDLAKASFNAAKAAYDTANEEFDDYYNELLPINQWDQADQDDINDLSQEAANAAFGATSLLYGTSAASTKISDAENYLIVADADYWSENWAATVFGCQASEAQSSAALNLIGERGQGTTQDAWDYIEELEAARDALGVIWLRLVGV